MKITAKEKEKAFQVMKDNELNEVFINTKGEFFSCENRALLSEKGNKKNIALIKKADSPDKEPEAESSDNENINLDKKQS